MNSTRITEKKAFKKRTYNIKEINKNMVSRKKAVN